jgi:hypothetical protein
VAFSGKPLRQSCGNRSDATILEWSIYLCGYKTDAQWLLNKYVLMLCY